MPSLHDFGYKFKYTSNFDGASGSLATIFGGPEPYGFYKSMELIESMGESFSTCKINMEMPYTQGLQAMDIFTIGDSIEIDYGYFPNIVNSSVFKTSSYPNVTVGQTVTIEVQATGTGIGLMKKRHINEVSLPDTLEGICNQITGWYGISNVIVATVSDDKATEMLNHQITEEEAPVRNVNDYQWLQQLCQSYGFILSPTMNGINLDPIRSDLSEVPKSGIFTLFGKFDLSDVPTIPIQSVEYESQHIMLNNSPKTAGVDANTGDSLESTTEPVSARGEVDTSLTATSGKGKSSVDGEMVDVEIEEGEYGMVVPSSPRSTGWSMASDSVYAQKQVQAVEMNFSTIGWPLLHPNDVVEMKNIGRLSGDYRVKEITHKLATSYEMDVALIPPSAN